MILATLSQKWTVHFRLAPRRRIFRKIGMLKLVSGSSPSTSVAKTRRPWTPVLPAPDREDEVGAVGPDREESVLVVPDPGVDPRGLHELLDLGDLGRELHAPLVEDEPLAAEVRHHGRQREVHRLLVHQRAFVPVAVAVGEFEELRGSVLALDRDPAALAGVVAELDQLGDRREVAESEASRKVLGELVELRLHDHLPVAVGGVHEDHVAPLLVHLALHADIVEDAEIGAVLHHVLDDGLGPHPLLGGVLGLRLLALLLFLGHLVHLSDECFRSADAP